MLRLLRKLVRLMFTAAAVAAVVWVGREAIRRWVDGPEAPQVAEGWQKAGSGGGAAVPAGSAGVGGEATPAEAAIAGETGGGDAAGGGASTAGAEPAARKSQNRAVKGSKRLTPPGAPSAPAKGPQRPIEGRKSPAPAPAPAPAGEVPAEGAPAGETRSDGAPRRTAAKAAKAAKATPRKQGKAAQPSGAPAPPAWVPPDGSGGAPSTHPVKAKLINRLYRVPGMPMYNRMIADRCYPDPESAAADGFKRAAR